MPLWWNSHKIREVFVLSFFKSINYEPNYLNEQVVLGSFSRLFYMFWRTILRGKGSSLNSGCTRYSHQQMVGFEYWNKWPRLSSSSEMFTSACMVQLLMLLCSATAKANLSEWEPQFIPKTKQFPRAHHLFWDSIISLESPKFAWHKTAVVEQWLQPMKLKAVGDLKDWEGQQAL